MPLLERWLQDAWAAKNLPNPDAIALATLRPDGQPEARIVLCKQIVPDPGYMVFYTNYNSAKGRAIEASPRVAGVFHWDALNRQARIEGIAIKSPAAESDAYFATRDKESQIGAWASSQSQPLVDRQTLKARHAATARKLSNLALDSGRTDIPRPPFWGGYRIWISAAELWVRGKARLHDRGRWERELHVTATTPPETGPWRATRLQP
jgi:pyridoxamine 5'-phosphate oxidase